MQEKKKQKNNKKKESIKWHPMQALIIQLLNSPDLEEIIEILNVAVEKKKAGLK